MLTTRTTPTIPLDRLRSGAQGLLVSVRDPQEAADALAGGADVIDVKDPAAGPLGAADPTRIAAILKEVGDRVPVTAALGELSEADASGLPAGLAAVKCGLAGATGTNLGRDLTRLRDQLPAETRLVPVAYADNPAAAAPPPEEVLAAAMRFGDGWLVIDTWDKRGPDALSLLPADRIRFLLQEASSAGIAVALAGRLSAETLTRAASFGPAILGVRGAVCDGGRDGRVAAGRVRDLVDQLAVARRSGNNSAADRQATVSLVPTPTLPDA